jgi:hypothetical protein
MSRIVRAVIVLLVCTQVAILLFAVKLHVNLNGELQSDQVTSVPPFQTGSHSIRLVCLIPYVGERLPSWFDAFAASAKSAAHIADFLVFLTSAPPRETPENVKLIYMPINNLADRILRLGDSHHDSSDDLVQEMASLLDRQPYILVEFKPALGSIFPDYLEGYSHWAFADLDILMGKLHRLATPNILHNFDIYTSSFGDNYRVYLRGQLTIHRNDAFINNLWRRCEHLRNIKNRVVAYVQNGRGKWALESAEGCYSKVVVTSNASVLISPSQMSDMLRAPSRIDQEVLVIGDRIIQCYEYPIDIGDAQTRASLIELLYDANDMTPLPRVEDVDHSIFNDNDNRNVKWRPISRRDYRCEEWFSPGFETCLDVVPPGAQIRCKSDEYEVQDGKLMPYQYYIFI